MYNNDTQDLMEGLNANKGKILGGLGTLAGLILTVVLLAMNVGINDNGYRTVIQYPWGNTTVKFNEGVYFPVFGKTTIYPDYLTLDFSPADGRCDFNQTDGIKVRYQDGGEGVVCGMASIQLPVIEEEMLAFHKRYRTEEGARAKLLNQEFPKVLNLTAGLLSSEEAYATKRADFISMGTYQANNGLYKTTLVEKQVVVGIDADGKEEKQLKEVPEIVFVDGKPQTEQSAFVKWNVTVSQFDLKSWDFEPRTITQIQNKRSAEMAIVEAKANAKKAYWQEQEVIANGQKAVASAKYEALTAAETEIQNAERDKALAIIEATKQKEKAQELTLAAMEEEKRQAALAKAAKEEAKVITTLADAEAHAKRVAIQADGALTQKLEALVTMNRDAWTQASRQKWVPEIVMGGDSEGTSFDATAAMVQTQLLKNAKALNLDMQVK